VLLRRAQVAGVLEGDPGVAGLEQHGEHAPPQVDSRDPLEHLDLAATGLRLVGLVGRLERLAVEVVQVGHLVWGKQRPLAARLDALHEQVGDPVGRVHVVGAAAVVAGVLAQVEELLDVDMPGLQIGADRALALAALVDRDGGVVGDLEEGHDALALAVGALDMGAQPPHRRPVVAEAAGELRQKRVVLHRLEDAVEIVGHRRQEAGRKLRAQRARIEQGRRRGHEIEGRDQVVELDRPGLAVDLAQRQPHGHAHEEGLRQLEAVAAHMQEIAVVERLEAEIVELEVALGLQRRGDPGKVEAGQFRVQPLVGDAGLHIGAEIVAVAVGHLGLRGLVGAAGDEAQRLAAQLVEQQPGADLGIVGLGLDECPRGQDGRLRQFVERDAVVEVAARFGQDRVGQDAVETRAGLRNHGGEARGVERHARAVGGRHMQHGGRGGVRGRRRQRPGPFPRPLLAVEHIGAGDLVVLAAHQRQLHLVLHVLDVDDAARVRMPGEAGDNLVGQAGDDVVDAARGGGGLAFDGQERLRQRDRDLGGVERRDRAVAPDQPVARLVRPHFGGKNRRVGRVGLSFGSRSHHHPRFVGGGGPADACAKPGGMRHPKQANHRDTPPVDVHDVAAGLLARRSPPLSAFPAPIGTSGIP